MKFDNFLKILQAKEKSKETKLSKALAKIQEPPDLSPDETTFKTLMMKLPVSEGTKVEWLEDELLIQNISALQEQKYKKMQEHKQQLEQTLFYSKGLANSSAASNAWWHGTNDPKYWYSHPPTVSVSATSSYNYTQVFPKNVEEAFMTREKAIAANDGICQS